MIQQVEFRNGWIGFAPAEVDAQLTGDKTSVRFTNPLVITWVLMIRWPPSKVVTKKTSCSYDPY